METYQDACMAEALQSGAVLEQLGNLSQWLHRVIHLLLGEG